MCSVCVCVETKFFSNFFVPRNKKRKEKRKKRKQIWASQEQVTTKTMLHDMSQLSLFAACLPILHWCSCCLLPILSLFDPGLNRFELHSLGGAPGTYMHTMQITSPCCMTAIVKQTSTCCLITPKHSHSKHALTHTV